MGRKGEIVIKFTDDNTEEERAIRVTWSSVTDSVCLVESDIGIYLPRNVYGNPAH